MSKTAKMLLVCILFPFWCMLAQQLTILFMDLLRPVYSISTGLATVTQFVFYTGRNFLVFLYVVAAPALFATPPQEEAWSVEPAHTPAGFRLPTLRQILAALAAGALVWGMNRTLSSVLGEVMHEMASVVGGDFAYNYIFLQLLITNLIMTVLYLLMVWLLVTFTHGKGFAQSGPEQAGLRPLCQAAAVVALAVVCLNNIWFYGGLAFDQDVWSPSLFNLFGLREAGTISNLNWAGFAAFTFLLWSPSRTGDSAPVSDPYGISRGY